jgi:hypothetical protein
LDVVGDLINPAIAHALRNNPAGLFRPGRGDGKRVYAASNCSITAASAAFQASDGWQPAFWGNVRAFVKNRQSSRSHESVAAWRPAFRARCAATRCATDFGASLSKAVTFSAFSGRLSPR